MGCKLKETVRKSVALATVISLFPFQAFALPEGGVVAAGSADISQTANRVEVRQNTDRTVIDWRGFDIEQNEETEFFQPSSSSLAINRVNSNSASNINGKLKANGNLVIINQNGVMFGSSANVDVNGIVATTVDIDNDEVMNSTGRLNYSKPGKPDATIVNNGRITAKEAGLIGLVAPNVENNGVISAKLGRVHLASGDKVTLDMYGDGLIEVEVSGNVKSQLVKNTGLLEADGGHVALTAAAGKDVINSLILGGGVIKAKSGKITLAAESSNSSGGTKSGIAKAIVTGKLDASGYNSGEKGGDIDVLADDIKISSSAEIDASGATGAGSIKIGGDYQGRGNVQRAKNTIIENGARIKANGLGASDAGKVIIWSDEYTSMAGFISANAEGLGNGGLIETSSKRKLQITDSAVVIAGSESGNKGTWLLDPHDITIQSSAGSTAAIGDPDFVADGAASYVLVSTIEAALNNNTDVTITTNFANGGASGNGDITVANAIGAAGAVTGTGALILSAYRNILVNAAITTNGGAITLRADNADNNSGYINVTKNITSNNGAITMGGGSGTIVGSILNADGSVHTAASGFAKGNGTSGSSLSGITLGLGATVDGGSGSIIMNGAGYTGGTNTASAYGVSLYSAVVTTSGSMHITGNGGGSGSGGSNFGVDIGAGSYVKGTGSNNIYIVGGSNKTTGNSTLNMGISNISGYGVEITSGNSGNIYMRGVGSIAPGNTNYGLLLNNGKVRNYGTGTVNIIGYGGGFSGNSASSYGFATAGTAEVSAAGTTGTNAISIVGYAGGSGTGTNNRGVHLTAGTIKGTGAGNVYVKGTGSQAGSGVSAAGVNVITNDGIQIASGGTGNIYVEGIGGISTGANNHGVVVSSGSIHNHGSGNIEIMGTAGGAGNSGSNLGFVLAGSSTSNGVFATGTAGTNAIKITGIAGGSGTGANNYGIQIVHALPSIIASGDGNILLRGYSGTGGNTATNVGTVISTANNVRTSSNGSIKLETDSISTVANGINSARNLAIAGYDNGTTISIGSGTNGTLKLTDTILNNMSWGSGYSLTIGNAQAGAIDYNTTRTFTNPLTIISNGTITLDSDINSSATGNAVTLAGVLNNAGNHLISSTGRWLIYSSTAGATTLGGLTPAFTKNNTPYASYLPANVVENGNGVIYSDGVLPPVDTLRFTANAVSRYFGDNNPTLTYTFYCSTGCVESDAVTGLLSLTTSATSASNVSGYNILAAQGSLALKSGYENYIFEFVDGTLTINQRPITVTVDIGQSKVYGNNDASFTYALTSGSLRIGDSLTGSLIRNSGENVGSYSILQGSLSVNDGNSGTNYVITYVGNNYGITARPLTITADSGQTKTYGGNNPVYTYALTSGSLKSGDTMTGILTRNVGENVGSYNILLGSLAVNDGNNSNNYNITYSGASFGITPAALLITAADATKVSGQTNPVFTATYSGFQFSDDENVLTGLAVTSTATSNSAAGTYDIVPTGASASNYQISFVNGVLTVTAAPVSTLPSTYTQGSQSPITSYPEPFDNDIFIYSENEYSAQVPDATLLNIEAVTNHIRPQLKKNSFLDRVIIISRSLREKITYRDDG